MVAPVVAVAAIAAATAIAQAWQSERARGANQREMEKLRRAFDSLVPPEYGLSVTDSTGKLQQTIPQLNLDFSQITPEAFQVIGNYAPQVAPVIKEQAPQLITGNAASQEGRQGQLDAYRQMLSAARGNDPTLKIKMAEANANAQQEAQQRQASILEDSQRRGQFGSGLMYMAQLQGAGDSMSRGAQAGRDSALAAYQAKMDAIRQSGSMGRDLANDENSIQAQNAAIINSFNQRTSMAAQNQLNLQNQIGNQAQQFNLERGQDVANRNTGARNDAQRYNLDNRNRLATQGYQSQLGEREYQNHLKQLAYNDRLNLERSRQGLGTQQIAMNNQNAADRNQIIQSVGNAGAGYYQQEEDRARWKEEQDRMDARVDKWALSRQGGY
jgi:hypothetical protein